MVFDEGDSSGGPHAHEAGGAALPIHQAPVLTSAHCLLQDACTCTPAVRVQSIEKVVAMDTQVMLLSAVVSLQIDTPPIPPTSGCLPAVLASFARPQI